MGCCRKKNPSSTDKKNTFVRCITSCACGTHWAYPHNKKCILSHAANVDDCSSMPEDLRSEAIAAMAVNAIGPLFQMPGASQTHNSSNTMALAMLNGPELKAMWVQYRGQAQRSHPWTFSSLRDTKNSKKMRIMHWCFCLHAAEFHQLLLTHQSSNGIPAL